MSGPVENELIRAVRAGIEDLRKGRKLRVRTIRVKTPPKYSAEQIAAIRRKKLKVSQKLFAEYLGVSLSAVHAWEQAQREPSPMACRLIQLAEEKPNVLQELAKP